VRVASLVATAYGLAHVPADPDVLLWIGEGSRPAVAADLTGALLDAGKWVPGKYGAGISLEAAGSSLEIPGAAAAPVDTLAFWFLPTWDGAGDEDCRILDSSFSGVYFVIGTGSAHTTPRDFGLYFEDLADADWQDVEFDPTDVIKAGEWFHVVATWESPGGNPFLYISGAEMATGANVTGEFPALFRDPRFGAETILYIPITNGVGGIIDGIATYGRVLE
jgi:hypothetical protein